MKFFRRRSRPAPAAASPPTVPSAPLQASSAGLSGPSIDYAPSVSENVRESVRPGAGWDDSEVVPAEVRARGMSPDSFGLYPHELLMLSYAPTFTTDHTDFQQFWWWQYGVQDPRELLASLTERGFVEVGGPEQAVARQTAASLKDLLRAHGLKLSGNKAEIVERVLSLLPHDTINPADSRAGVTAAVGDDGLVFA